MTDSVILKRCNSWNLGSDDEAKALALMKEDGLTKEEMDDPLRAFLYAKGIMRSEESIVRKTEFNNLLDPDSARIPAEERDNLKAAKERLRRIVEKGEDGREFQPGQSAFDLFVTKHPEWSPDKSFVVFRDHDLLKGKKHAYVERVQLSGLCYMHAPVVLQHYLVAMNTSELVPMLDMADYLKKHMPADALQKRIWNDEGGNSVSFLKGILESDPELLHCLGRQNLEPCIKEFGPALLSSFDVEHDFVSEEWQHLKRKSRESKGLHAMLIVGVRKEGDSVRYLLQNWWKTKPFVEVSGAYIESCAGAIHFVQTKQDSIGSFTTNPYSHVECDMLDIGEQYNWEN